MGICSLALGLGLKQYCAIPFIFSRIRVPWFQARHAKRANSAMMSSLTVCKTSTVEEVASWLSGKRLTNLKVGHSWTLSGDSSDYSRISIALLGPSHDHYAYSRASSRLGIDYWYTCRVIRTVDWHWRPAGACAFPSRQHVNGQINPQCVFSPCIHVVHWKNTICLPPTYSMTLDNSLAWCATYRIGHLPPSNPSHWHWPHPTEHCQARGCFPWGLEGLIGKKNLWA